MMMKEFIDRTGFEPTSIEYEEIENEYYEFDGDKDAFCKKWVKEGGIQRLSKARVQMIQKLNADIKASKIEHMSQIDEMQKWIDQLTADLERELEWHDSDDGTKVSEADYEALLREEGSKLLADAEARDVLAFEFGFEKSKIQIVHEVFTAEVNRHGKCRWKEKYHRDPVYNTSFRNYIRFDCAARSYEMIDGKLKPYATNF